MRRLIAALATCALVTLTAPPAVAQPDPLRPEQWGLDTAQLPAAWATSRGGNVTIAVVDSGVDASHPDLAGKLVPGHDFVDGDDDPRDENGHGTHVAGIAAAATENGVGIAGAAPEARIMPVRVLDAQGIGTSDAIANGVLWAAEHDAQVINLSLGEEGIGSRLTKGGALNQAIRAASSRDAVVVAAAGNEGVPKRAYRLNVPVLVVGAIDANSNPAGFSNFGDFRALTAPGTDIVSTIPTYATVAFPDPGTAYAPLSGTSMATPFVSATAALLVAAGHSPDAATDIILDTAANPSEDPQLGAGVLDAAAATGVPTAATTREAPPATEPESGAADSLAIAETVPGDLVIWIAVGAIVGLTVVAVAVRVLRRA